MVDDNLIAQRREELIHVLDFGITRIIAGVARSVARPQPHFRWLAAWNKHCFQKIKEILVPTKYMVELQSTPISLANYFSVRFLCN